MRITLVVAAAENNVIGDSRAQNGIPWHLPNDLQHFRAVTLGKPVIMGRKTLQKIGRALPDRRNIVVTHQLSVPFRDVEVTGSLDEALALARACQGGAEEICIIGGGEIYRQALPLADRVELTRVHAEIEGDTTFPVLNPAEWKEVAAERHEPDHAHVHPYTFFTYERGSVA